MDVAPGDVFTDAAGARLTISAPGELHSWYIEERARLELVEAEERKKLAMLACLFLISCFVLFLFLRGERRKDDKVTDEYVPSAAPTRWTGAGERCALSRAGC